MAISKILNMKDCGGHFHGKHLKRSLDYVMNPEKTQDGRLVGAINCQVDSAFEQMKATKRKFGKVDKRQGYHIILSFKEDEVNPDTAFEITRRFVVQRLESVQERSTQEVRLVWKGLLLINTSCLDVDRL